MPVVLGFKSILHRSCQTLAAGTVGGMVKEHIRLLPFATAIHMQEDGTAICIIPAVFLIKFIDFGTALAKTIYLVQRNSIPHAGFTLAVFEITVVANAVSGILNNDINLCPLFHQVTGKAEGYIIGVFVFMQFGIPYPADSSGVRPAMSADYVEAGAFQSATAEGYDAIDYAPPKTLYRLVEKFPENVFDGKVLHTPYNVINLSDEMATGRARDEAKDRALSFIKDTLRLTAGYGQRVQKDELARASLSVGFLLKELNG